MISTMRFVGAPVETLLEHTAETARGSDTDAAAERLLGNLVTVGEPFEVPRKLQESLAVLSPWIPAGLELRLLNPGMRVPSNHLEASVLALAREGGVCLETFSAADLRRLQHGAQRAIQAGTWGRQSPHPWDVLADADIDSDWFFAFSAPLDVTAWTTVAA